VAVAMRLRPAVPAKSARREARIATSSLDWGRDLMCYDVWGPCSCLSATSSVASKG